MKKRISLVAMVCSFMLLLVMGVNGVYAKYVADKYKSFVLDVHKWQAQKITIGEDADKDKLHVDIDENGVMRFLQHDVNEPTDWCTIVGIVDGWDDNLGVDKSSITAVEFPNTLETIGDNAFVDTSLQSVTIPAATTSIGASAFEGITTLRSVVLEGNNVSLGEKVFLNCTNLTSMTTNGINTSDISGLLKLNTFDQYINGVVNENWASKGSNHWIRTNYPCDIRDGVLYQDASGYNSTLGYMLVQYPIARASESFVIPSDVVSIDRKAFRGSKISAIEFGNVKLIGNYAFENCMGLTSIHIPNSVSKIYGGAFMGCKSAASLTFASGVKLTTLGGWAFSQMRLEGTVELPQMAETILYEGMFNVSGTASIIVPNGIKEIKGKAFGQCDAAAIYLPSTVTTIANNAFIGKTWGNLGDAIVYYNGSLAVPDNIWTGVSGQDGYNTSVNSTDYIIVVNTSGMGDLGVNVTGRKNSSGYTVTLTGSNIPSSVSVTDNLGETKTYTVTNGQFNIPKEFTDKKTKLTMVA